MLDAPAASSPGQAKRLSRTLNPFGFCRGECMSRTRFVTSLGALLLVFVGGGYAIDHWDELQGRVAPGSAPAVTQANSSGDSEPAAGSSEGVVVAQSSSPTTPAPASEEAPPAAEAPELKMKKEFDPAAADAAAEAEAAQQGSADSAGGAETPAATRSATSEAVLVTASLDAVQLSATGTSVIAGKAPAGTTVTLIANEVELASAVADAQGDWIVTLEAPVAPGTYKLKLKAVGPNGGEAVVREAGETTVAAPETVAGAAAASDASASTASETAETAPAEAAADIVVPGTETFGIGTIVPPDLIAPPAAEAATASSAPATSEPASAADAEVAQASEIDPSLADQAGEAAESLSDMFTDWLTATDDAAAEAAKSFSLTGATYKPVAKGQGVVTLSGRGPPGAEVRLFVDTLAVGVTKVAESGRWLAEADHGMEPGAHSARAEIIGTDGAVLAGHDLAFTSAGPPETVAAAEATAPSADSEVVAPSVLLAIADVAYENMGPKKGRITVGGRAEPAARVAVYADGKAIGTAEAAESGDWTLASDTWMDVGAHAIRAERVAASGEIVESTLTEFVRAPAEAEVAAAETPSTEVAGEAGATPEVAALQPAKKKKTQLKKSRKAQLARAAHRKRIAALARARRVRLVRARAPKLKTVTVLRGASAVRARVTADRRKPHVLGYLRRRGPGWVRVKRGDSLWRIADRCYGDGRHYPVILARNWRSIRNPDRIYPRQRLFVP